VGKPVLALSLINKGNVMGKLEDVVEDIYELLENENEIPDEVYEEFGRNMADAFRKQLGQDRGNDLSMSQLGSPGCKLWFKANEPEKGEPLRGQTRLKFLYGDLIEAMIITLIKATGKHEVTGEQTKLELDGVSGSRDCVIDGVLVDVKSASTYSMKKFKDNGLYNDDPFGYLPQIEAYHEASEDCDPTRFAFLAIDKQHASISLDVYETKRDGRAAKNVHDKKQAIQGDFPGRSFQDVPDGKAGNRKLATQCSYCDFKEACWPGLRTYLYASGPRFLTVVKRTPDVPEKSVLD
jgi:hypothetical protein